ncbi:IclR family transcriptional regulator C-terminal domain-containing protein [Streptomyces sp. NPDC089799]|uniref:IclR family transcriptional regulator domain-containing protein n=1 Tax=Streptomyces sp. NPDC089799 TaxID=3155066 RepID=UPI003420C9DF
MSRLNDDSRDRPASAGLVELMAQLGRPEDTWDRPGGDFGPLASLYGLDRDGWERANSQYLLGSKALARGELAAAADWLGQAAAAGHPGAMFRMAALTLRAGADWADEARFLLAEATRHGHGDAAQLLAGLARRRPPLEADTLEDPEYFEEIREGLGVPAHILHPDTTSSPARQDTDGDTGKRVQALPGRPPAVREEPGGGQPRLFLVPAPQVPQYGPPPHDPNMPVADTKRPQLAALSKDGLQLPIPELQPSRSATVLPLLQATTAEVGGSEPQEPWWSANALRPAVLNDMGRHRSSPARVPEKWQATQRARDLLHLIAAGGGIDSRTLAHKAGMSLNTTVRMLDWLLGQRLVETVAGAYFTGPVMDLVTGPGPGRGMLSRALEQLRDDLGAAVYISTYTHGEIEVKASAHSPTAPPVDEWAPFTDTAHASAVGKSLLAQLDFDSRMDHLSRYPSIPLTHRTITSERDLIESLDQPGPHAAQFDLLEYSDHEVCVAYSLGLPGRASSIALSLPAREHPRLITAAQALSQRATGLLLAHLLTDDHQPAHPTATTEEQPRRALP